MSLDDLRDALEALDEHAVCDGIYEPSERIALMLPDGDVGAIDDPGFVDWLLAHAELAPFGDGTATRRDPAVRNAQRLIARGKVTVTGFEHADLIAQVENYLLPAGQYFEATLTDVLVYPTGGRFANHRDTPYTRDLVGTLVVELPSAHTGGAFVVDDGSKQHRFDWSAPADGLRWVALHADVDHEVELVTSGARVTLVYALSSPSPARTAWSNRLANVQRVIARLRETEPFIVVCARHVITGAEPPTLASLRGTDRELAQVFLDAGFTVTVRECVIASSIGDERFVPDDELTPARLAMRIPPEVIANLEPLVTFAPANQIVIHSGSDYDADAASSLAAYVLPGMPIERWVIRSKAAATVLRETVFDQYGFFGNGGFDAYLYALAALEITR